NQQVLENKVWTSNNERITPTIIDGVTISASPVTNSLTPWISLDSTGIPYKITPTTDDDGETVSASPTPTESDYPDPTGVPPVLRCFGDRVASEFDSTPGYPFCTARNGTELLVGETYWITWDPTYWGSTEITKVRLSINIISRGNNDEEVFMSDYINNNNGYYPLAVESSFEGYGFLLLTPLTTSTTEAEHVGTVSGPVVRFITSKSQAATTISRLPSDNGLENSSSSGNKNLAKIIAPSVIIPFIIIVGGFVVFYIW
ncbi:uncharacterized protein ASCRUDRAFT_19952, partial [Ascoidea rubescens DSM 1968]